MEGGKSPNLHSEKICNASTTCTKSSYMCPVRFTSVMEVPFHKVGVDMTPPSFLIASQETGSLWYCGYATRYPEAMPMTTVDTEHVAEPLITVYSRVEIVQ